MPVALLSVSDKTGLVEFAKGLADRGWDLVSTGGTAKALRDATVPVRDISDLTGFPEMLDGRVKTLHPVVHGGLLARRSESTHMDAVESHSIPLIDLVAVNLYPFRETAAKQNVSDSDVIEQIDIGGPAMLRSAAKNFESVTVVCDPSDYQKVLEHIDSGEAGSLDFKRRLASKVFEHTAAYDSAISTWFAEKRKDLFPEQVTVSFSRAQTLRYGENPGQKAAFYTEYPGAGLAGLKQLSGKELSFNNLLDLEGALMSSEPFGDEPCCAIIKHTTPCGLAVGTTALEAYQKALACDPVSAFGSIISFSVPVDAATAEAVSSLFVECIVAPSFDEEALEILSRKKNLRVLAGSVKWGERSLDYKRVRGGFLAQERPLPPVDDTQWQVVTKRSPTDAEHKNMSFAWKAVGSVKSNAIILVQNGATIGIGAGQMSRVDASFLATHKAKSVGHDTGGSVLGSDAFFPFRDGVDQAAAAGISAIIQPGGSVRDAEVIEAANEHNIAMVFTGQRQFRH